MSDQDLRPRFDIRAISFDEDTVQIQYMHLPNDVRFKGALVATHTLTVNGADLLGWHNEVEDLKSAAYHLLQDALEDFNDSDPADMEDLFGDDDDEKGMGE